MFTWLQTHSGKKFDYVNPTVAMIDLKDIARGLARIPRFMAQTNLLITVAEHSMYVADNLPEDIRLEGLMHDAAEAYTGDVPAPLKHLLGESFKGIERRIETVIAERFGLQYPFDKRIKEMDSHALYCEAAHFMVTHRPIEKWHEYFRKPITADNTRLVKMVNGNRKNAAQLTEEFIAYAVPLMLRRQVQP